MVRANSNRFRPQLRSLEDRLAPAAGLLDPTFSGDGRALISFPGNSNDAGTDTCIDSLGRVIVAGYSNTSTVANFSVARLTSAGELDTSFGIGGKVTVAFGSPNSLAFAYGVAVDSLDRIVVVGESNGDVAVARLTPVGALDTSFDGDGKCVFSFGPSADAALAVAIDSLDRAVIAGYSTIGSTSDIAIARLTVSGGLDKSFDGDGRLTFSFGSFDDAAYALAIDSQDRIVVAGESYTASNNDFAVARLTTSGSLDSTFSGDGKVTIPFGLAYDYASGVAIDSQERIVVGGSMYNGLNHDFAVARLTEIGVLDSNFSNDGKETIDFNSSDDVACGLAVDSHDRVFVGGNSHRTGQPNDAAVLRLTNAGKLDLTYGAGGKSTFGFGGTSEASGLVVDAAGRACTVGSAWNNRLQFGIARLTDDTTTATAQVNDGAIQRSRVNSLTITFSAPVTFAGSIASAFTLARIGGGSVSFNASASVVNGVTVVTLNHFLGSESEFGSFRDGRYTLTALCDQIICDGLSLDGDANGMAGGNYTFGDSQGLFRMFGDFNGDRQVDGLDFSAFSSTFNLTASHPNFLALFDINSDGQIDGVDFSQFSGRFNTLLP